MTIAPHACAFVARNDEVASSLCADAISVKTVEGRLPRVFDTLSTRHSIDMKAEAAV
jgi:hypothetical protein